MNREVLLVIKYNGEDKDRFINKINYFNDAFKYIIIVNNTKDNISFNNIKLIDKINILDDINKYIVNNKLNINEIAFIEHIDDLLLDDLVNCLKDANNNKDTIVFGIDANNNLVKKFINKSFNLLFNTNFKDILPNIKVINIKLFKELLEKNNLNNNNYMIMILNDNIEIYEQTVKTIYHKNKRKGEYKLFSYLKDIFPYFWKSILPYIISIILFILIFYIKNDTNDLNGIFIANIISEGIGIAIHILLNYNTNYKNNYVSKNVLFIIKKILRIILASILIYVSYNLLGLNLIISKLLIDLILMLIIAFIFSKVPHFQNK